MLNNFSSGYTQYVSGGSGDAAHGFFGAFADALAAFYAEGVVYDGESFGVLRDGADGALLYERAHVVVRACVLVYLYHNLFFFCKINATFSFHKTDFIYICIDKIEQT